MELTLVGTGHVFAIGEKVQDIIRTRRPDVVAVELDPLRLRGLHERRRIKRLERRDDPQAAKEVKAYREAQKKLPFVYKVLAGVQERIADAHGVEPGSEMLAAVEAAQQEAIPVGCIDVDAQRLIRRAWKAMGFFERIRFLWALTYQGKSKGSVDTEMEAYEADPVTYLAAFGDKFPSLKKVLIDDRDAHMAKRIVGLRGIRFDATGRPVEAKETTPPVAVGETEKDLAPEDEAEAVTGAEAPGEVTEVTRIVAVVGDGHVEGILAHLEGRLGADDTLEVVRLKALRAGDRLESPFPARPRPGMQEDPGSTDPGGASVGFSVEVDQDPATYREE